MNLPARLILMITIVVAVTDVILYIHLKQHPEHLTITFFILEIVVTIVPMAIIILTWHIRKLL
jgi:hypothetical protein